GVGGVQRVAVKLSHCLIGGPEAKRLMWSLDIIRSIRHEHLLPLLAYGDAGGRVATVMDIADADLAQWAQARGRSGCREVAQYIMQAAKAVDHLNTLKVIHGCIKPADLLMFGGCVKLADFDLIHVLDFPRCDGLLERADPRYVAPEIWLGTVSPW